VVAKQNHMQTPLPDADQRRKHQRGRSIAIALALAGLVLLFYLVTIVKLGPDVLQRPL
jgi:hypothetical protein